MDRLMPLGRSLEEFKPLGPAEQLVLGACQKGEVADLGSAVPESATDALRVRAIFLRFLLLGGDEQTPVHERGVQLRGAFVQGPLDLTGCRIRASVDLKHCHFDSLVQAMDAQVDGLLTLQGSHLADGLSADRLRCSAGVFLRNGFTATGEVSLGGAQIGGGLDCGTGQFRVKEGHALSADGAGVKGDVILSGGFKAIGPVRLQGAQIGGSLECGGGQFDGKEGDALSADGASVIGDVILSNGFRAAGEVRLLGVQIGGDLSCSGGHFEVKEGDALSADRADVKGSVFLRGGFKATGEVRLLGAQIGGALDCDSGQFEVRDGAALSADGANVKGNVFLRGGFKATGRVRLPGAQIGGSLSCVGGQFEVKQGAALSLDGAVVRGPLHLHGLAQAVRVDASHADVAVLVDELAAWAPGSVLDGFRYAALGGPAPTRGMDRLNWLRQQPPGHLGDTEGGSAFRPQPWRQVQRVLREMGHTEDAKQVGIAFEDRLRAIGRLGQSPPGTPAAFARLKRLAAQSAHYAFGKLAGYGYRPIRLLAWMVSVWLFCGLAYWWLALPPRSALAPSDPLVFQNKSYDECLPDRPGKPGNWFLCGPLRGEYATFSPLAFSLDVLLPLVDLGQEKTWGAFVPTPAQSPLEELFCHWHWGHGARLLVWFETLFGWLSSLLLVAIVSGFSRRNDEG